MSDKDWRFFSKRRDRCYRIRPTSDDEIVGLRESGAYDGTPLAAGCLLASLVRIDREAMRVHKIITVLPVAHLDLDNDDALRDLWFALDVDESLAAIVSGTLQ